MSDLADIRILSVTAEQAQVEPLQKVISAFEAKVLVDEAGDGDSLISAVEDFAADIVVLSHYEIDKMRQLIARLREHFVNRVPYLISISDTNDQQSAMRNLGEVDIDSLLFASYTPEQVRLNLSSGYRYHKHHQELQSRLNQASATAKEAIETASAIGFVMKLVDALRTTTTYEEVANEVLQICSGLGLKLFMMIRGEQPQFFPCNQVTDSKVQLLERASCSDVRLIEHQRVLLLRMDLVVFMISNAPWEDSASYGRIKDFFCQMGTVVESRVRIVMINQMIAEQHENLMSVMNLMRQFTIDTQANTRNIMKRLSDDIEVAALSLDLNEQQEAHLLSLSDKAFDSIEMLYDQNDVLESHFHSIIDSLSKVRELSTRKDNNDDDTSGNSDVELF